MVDFYSQNYVMLLAKVGQEKDIDSADERLNLYPFDPSSHNENSKQAPVYAKLSHKHLEILHELQAYENFSARYNLFERANSTETMCSQHETQNENEKGDEDMESEREVEDGTPNDRVVAIVKSLFVSYAGLYLNALEKKKITKQLEEMFTRVHSYSESGKVSENEYDVYYSLYILLRQKYNRTRSLDDIVTDVQGDDVSGVFIKKYASLSKTLYSQMHDLWKYPDLSSTNVGIEPYISWITVGFFYLGSGKTDWLDLLKDTTTKKVVSSFLTYIKGRYFLTGSFPEENSTIVNWTLIFYCLNYFHTSELDRIKDEMPRTLLSFLDKHSKITEDVIKNLQFCRIYKAHDRKLSGVAKDLTSLKGDPTSLQSVLTKRREPDEMVKSAKLEETMERLQKEWRSHLIVLYEFILTHIDLLDTAKCAAYHVLKYEYPLSKEKTKKAKLDLKKKIQEFQKLTK
jgi:hypothetical protein